MLGDGRGNPRSLPAPGLGKILRHLSKQQIPVEKALRDGEGAAAVVTASWLVTAASEALPPRPDPLTSNTASAKPAQLGSPTKASTNPILWGLLYITASPKKA